MTKKNSKLILKILINKNTKQLSLNLPKKKLSLKDRSPKRIIIKDYEFE